MSHVERLIKLIALARVEGWYEDNSRWGKVEELLTILWPSWREES